MIDDKEKKAQAVIRKLFKGFPGTTMSREEAERRVSPKTFQNNSGPMATYDLVEYVRDEGVGRKILNIALTEKGKKVANGTYTPTSALFDPSILTDINALGELVASFNSGSHYYELKLVPKEVASQK